MVQVSTHFLLAALAASPAFAAPIASFVAEGTPSSVLEARSKEVLDLELESRTLANLARPFLWTFGKKAFLAFAGAAGLGVTMAPAMFKKPPKEDATAKRGFTDVNYADEMAARDYFDGEFDARGGALEEPVEYFVARSEDGTFKLYERRPISAQAILSLGTTLGKITSALKRHSHWAFPAIGGAGFAVGAIGRKNTLRSFDEGDAVGFREYIVDLD